MTTNQKDEITRLATETARMFVDEFGEQIDPAATDWDAVAWDDDRRKLSFSLEDANYGEAWEFYSDELVRLTGEMSRCNQ